MGDSNDSAAVMQTALQILAKLTPEHRMALLGVLGVAVGLTQ
jgi:hypothetical protein